MELVALLLLLSSPAVAMKSEHFLPRIGTRITTSRLSHSGNTQSMTDLKVTDHIIPLTRGTSRSMSAVYVQAIRQQAIEEQGGMSRIDVCVFGFKLLDLTKNQYQQNGTVSLTSAEAGQVFLAPVTVGNQRFEVIARHWQL